MSLRADNERLRRCISMAMGCISPLAKNVDERLAWYRLFDALEGREPRNSVTLQKLTKPEGHSGVRGTIDAQRPASSLPRPNGETP